MKNHLFWNRSVHGEGTLLIINFLLSPYQNWYLVFTDCRWSNKFNKSTIFDTTFLQIWLDFQKLRYFEWLFWINHISYITFYVVFTKWYTKKHSMPFACTGSLCISSGSFSGIISMEWNLKVKPQAFYINRKTRKDIFRDKRHFLPYWGESLPGLSIVSLKRISASPLGKSKQQQQNSKLPQSIIKNAPPLMNNIEMTGLLLKK